MGTPWPTPSWRVSAKLRQRSGAVTSSFLYHYARLIEILACLERIERLLDDPDLLSDHLRADAGINKPARRGRQRGAARHPVPRLHRGPRRPAHQVNLIIATGQNNLAMNRTVAQIARHYIKGEIPEGLLNRVEARHPRLRPLPELLHPPTEPCHWMLKSSALAAGCWRMPAATDPGTGPAARPKPPAFSP
jgi:hypothetical protein